MVYRKIQKTWLVFANFVQVSDKGVLQRDVPKYPCLEIRSKNLRVLELKHVLEFYELRSESLLLLWSFSLKWFLAHANSNPSKFILSPDQTIATCQCNISQHSREQHVACFWPP